MACFILGSRRSARIRAPRCCTFGSLGEPFFALLLRQALSTEYSADNFSRRKRSSHGKSRNFRRALFGVQMSEDQHHSCEYYRQQRATQMVDLVHFTSPHYLDAATSCSPVKFQPLGTSGNAQCRFITLEIALGPLLACSIRAGSDLRSQLMISGSGEVDDRASSPRESPDGGVFSPSTRPKVGFVGGT